MEKFSSYVLLRCKSINSPPTNVTWMINGVPVPPYNDHYVMEQHLLNSRSATYDNTLRIDVAVLRSGEFNCSVRNALGSHSAYINLSVCKFLIQDLIVG